MSYTVKYLDNNRKIEFESITPYETIKDESVLDQVFVSLREKINIPGFRKGKNIPLDIIERHIGVENIVTEAHVNLILYFQNILFIKECLSLFYKTVSITNLVYNKDDKQVYFNFTSEILVKANDLRIESPQPIELNIDIKSSDIEEHILNIRRSRMEYKNVDNSVSNNSGVTLNIKYSDNDYNDKSSESIYGILYSLEENNLIEGINTILIDKVKNDKFQYKGKFIDSYLIEQYITDNRFDFNKEYYFNIEILGVHEPYIPELTVEFIKSIGYNDIDSIEEYKNILKDELKKSRIDEEYLSVLHEDIVKSIKIQYDSFYTDDINEFIESTILDYIKENKVHTAHVIMSQVNHYLSSKREKDKTISNYLNLFGVDIIGKDKLDDNDYKSLLKHIIFFYNYAFKKLTEKDREDLLDNFFIRQLGFRYSNKILNIAYLKSMEMYGWSYIIDISTLECTVMSLISNIDIKINGSEFSIDDKEEDIIYQFSEVKRAIGLLL